MGDDDLESQSSRVRGKQEACLQALRARRDQESAKLMGKPQS